MELSKEVHSLLDRIKKLSDAQKPVIEDNYGFDMNMTYSTLDDIEYNSDEFIPIDDIDLSDKETWLYVSEDPQNSGDINLREVSRLSEVNSLLDFENGYKKNVDTRTFTRPKKRLVRPPLDRISDGNETFNKSNSINEEINDIDQIKIPENPFNNNLYKKDGSISTGPLHFKLSDPVLNNSFDSILFANTDGLDSFQNMSPPSLMNSLCSTSLMDSSLIQNTSNSILLNESIKSNISEDNISQESSSEFLTPIKSNSEVKNSMSETVILAESEEKTLTNDKTLEKSNKSVKKISKLVIPKTFNTTFDKEDLNDENQSLNATFNTKKEKTLNSTYVQLNKTDSDSSLNCTFSRNKLNSFLKTPRNITNLNDSFKLSCPDINKTFQSNLDRSLNKTYQKLSDSQPNLTKDVQQTILNQSLELRNSGVYEGYRNTKCGSTDSLDEKSSSISNSSKESNSKVLNMGELDNLARLQEQSLHQIMSTPKPKSSMTRFWDTEPMSPILNSEEYLSEDSDMTDFSEPCFTARSGSQPSSGSTGSLTYRREVNRNVNVDKNKVEPLNETRTLKNETRRLSNIRKDTSRNETRNITVPKEVRKPVAVGYSRNIENIVKPLETQRSQKSLEKPNTATISQPSRLVQPKARPSGLPRPTSVNTGIPRPLSRIPAPRFNRPQLSRTTTRTVKKNNWMDGCY